MSLNSAQIRSGWLTLNPVSFPESDKSLFSPVVEGKLRELREGLEALVLILFSPLWNEMESSRRNDGRSGPSCNRQNVNKCHINDIRSRRCEGDSVKRGCCFQREAA